ncbi:hypothetical protein [Streptomyces specialis]|uniref:hypothetical protein n=1 Tax=Streptomyces specialis TaxID=498367 RepID=UPI00131DBAC3|nr:hypothetical protein [Streptomyces specialis]
MLVIEHVERAQDGDAVCVVRCLSGVARQGMWLTADQVTPLRLEWITRYERPVEILDPPHNAKGGLAGPDVEGLRPGMRLVSLAEKPDD